MLAVMFILLLIVTSNMFVHYFEFAASNAMPGFTVVKFISALMSKYVAYLLPISLFFSILIVYGKLFSNHELMVSFACGISWLRLVKITLVPALIIFFIECFLSLSFVPYMMKNLDILKKTAGKSAPLEFIQEGKLITLSDGKQVIYVEHINRKKQKLKDIFIYYKRDGSKKPIIVTAPEGYPETGKNGNQYLVLKNGHYYQGIPGKTDFKTGTFDKATQFLASNYVKPVRHDLESISFTKLIQKDSAEASAELQWRISFPLAVLILTLIAIAVCRIKPRQGQFGKIIPGVLVFMVYFNFISLSRNWIGDGLIPTWIGVWWVHILFGGWAIGMIKYMNGPITNGYVAKPKAHTKNRQESLNDQ